MPSLEEFFDLERRFTGLGVPETAITAEECFRRLIDDGLWWDACAEALHSRPDLLRAWMRDGCWALDVIDDTDAVKLPGTSVDGWGVAAVGAWHVVSLAWLLSEMQRQDGESVDSVLAGAVHRWRDTHLLPVHGVSRLPSWVAARHPYFMGRLDELGGGLARSMVAFEVGLLSARSPRRLRRERMIRVLFDDSHSGLLGTLRMGIVRGGPSGLFPDPRTMFDFQADAAFQDALTVAWRRQSDGKSDMPCVLWRLSIDDTRLRLVSGASLGAAFAVLLEEILGPPTRSSFVVSAVVRTRWAFSHLLRTPRKRQAVTGRIEASGQLGSVGGMAAKFERAAQSGLSVVAPQANQHSDGHLADGVRVAWATTVAMARRHLYRLDPRRMGILAICLAVLLPSAVLGLVMWRDDGSAQLKAALSRRLAEAGVRVSATDPQLAALLTVAAHKAAPTAEARQSMMSVLASPARAVLDGHIQNPLRSVALSPSGRTVVTGSDDEKPMWWDVPSRRPASPINNDFYSGQSVVKVVFSPDGRFVAATHNHGGGSLWDGRTRGRLHYFGHYGSTTAISFTPDSKRLLFSDYSRRLLFWDIAEQRVIDAGYPKLVQSTDLYDDLVFSPDGRTLATMVYGADGASVQLWDVAMRVRRGRAIRVARVRPAFSADGRTVAVAGADGGLMFLDARRGTRKATLPTGRVSALGFNPRLGLWIVGDEEGVIRLWDRELREAVGMALTGHDGPVNSIDIDRGGTTLVSGGEDGKVRLWDLSYSHPLLGPLNAGNDDIAFLAFSPDAAMLWTDSGWSFQRSEGGWTRGRDTDLVRVISNDGKMWATQREGGVTAEGSVDPGPITLHSFSSDKPLRTFDRVDGVTAELLALNRDGSRMVVSLPGDGTGEMAVAVVDTATGQRVGKPIEVPLAIEHLAFGNENASLAMSYRFDGESLDQRVDLWDLTGPRFVRRLEQNAGVIEALAISHDGTHVAAATSDRTIRLWNAPTGQLVGPPVPAGQEVVGSLVFSPDGRRLMAASGFTPRIPAGYKNMRWWDVESRRTVAQPIEGGFTALAFTADGTQMATGGDKGRVWLWNVSVPTDLDHVLCTMTGKRRITPEEWQAHTQQTTVPRICSP
ncbi:WD40 repeat domain-containing protein [Nonomuraea wenchangensis]